jgi:hypothetical protein
MSIPVACSAIFCSTSARSKAQKPLTVQLPEWCLDLRMRNARQVFVQTPEDRSTQLQESLKQSTYPISFGHILFVACATTHLCLATIGWNNPLLDRFSFRQCQTAITSDYVIQHGLRLHYLTPVLGKPWSIPFEFPLYQWIVALLAKTFTAPLDQTGRFVSLAFFYLTLIPTYFFLKGIVHETGKALIILSLIVASPIYIFYSRTFMIESLALFLSMSFLVFAASALRQRDWRLLVPASIFGVLAALVKITTFLVFYAAIGALFMELLLTHPAKDPKSHLLQYAGYAAGVFVPSLLAVRLWTGFADGVKAKNPLAQFILSSHLVEWNFGTLAQRLSINTWLKMADLALGPMVGGGALLFLLFLMPSARDELRKYIVVCLIAFLAGPAIFTNLYYVHEYYWYANAMFLLIAIGLCVTSILDIRKFKWAAEWIIAPAAIAVLYFAYAQLLLPSQRSADVGLASLAKAISDSTNKEAVILIYGFDWDPTLPYYAHRRALMDRSNRPLDGSEMTAALAELKDSPVTAMVVGGRERSDPAFVQERVRRFGLCSIPKVKHPAADIYVNVDANPPALLPDGTRIPRSE